jgi:hypothetical protein
LKEKKIINENIIRKKERKKETIFKYTPKSGKVFMEIDNNDSTATNNNKAYVPAAISKLEHYKPLCEVITTARSVLKK